MLYLRTSVFSLKGERGLGKERLYKARHSSTFSTYSMGMYIFQQNTFSRLAGSSVDNNNLK